MVYYIGEIPVSPYLEHFGIKGMKWGVRRFQNEDGTYTAAGKQRYGIVDRVKDGVNRHNEIEQRYRKALSKERMKQYKRKHTDFGLTRTLDRRSKGIAKGYGVGGAISVGRSYHFKRKLMPFARFTAAGLLVKTGLYKNQLAVTALDHMTRSHSKSHDAVMSVLTGVRHVTVQKIYDEYKIAKKTGISKKQIAAEYDREKSGGS